MEIKGRTCVVADETGSMSLDMRSDHTSKFTVGSHIVVRNAKVAMNGKFMKLTVDKWGSIESTSDILSAEPKLERDFSRVEYNILAK